MHRRPNLRQHREWHALNPKTYASKIGRRLNEHTLTQSEADGYVFKAPTAVSSEIEAALADGMCSRCLTRRPFDALRPRGTTEQ